MVNVMPRRIPSFPDSVNSWNSLSSVGSGRTFLSFGSLRAGVHFSTSTSFISSFRSPIHFSLRIFIKS